MRKVYTNILVRLDLKLLEIVWIKNLIIVFVKKKLGSITRPSEIWLIKILLIFA